MLKYNNLSDYHVHSHFSSDSEESISNIINKATELGLKSLCFTDHIDFDYPAPKDNPELTFLFDTDAYFKELGQIENSSVDIKIGVELGQMPYLSGKNNEFVMSYPFDFVIASTHLVNGMDPYYPSFWEGRKPDAVIRQYYEYTLECVKAYNNYDVYGHLDYISRYIPKEYFGSYVYNPHKFMDVIEAILKEIIPNGHGIEINSGALAKGLPSPNPSADIIKLYKDLGGEIITMGSDAHRAENIAFSFEKMRAILLDAGFKYYTEFSERKPSFTLL